jgi:hypothetical protein
MMTATAEMFVMYVLYFNINMCKATVSVNFSTRKGAIRVLVADIHKFRSWIAEDIVKRSEKPVVGHTDSEEKTCTG